ncbi:MAG TPA: AAA family ATPase [Pseudonocardiaceae bacterium]|nr:AAA family ATPase [Pseudonocardiaceae bacterium]
MPGNTRAESIDRKSLRFTRLSVRNWRNFTRLDANLQQRMFLIGPNASGKSNLLDSFRFLSETVSVGGGFEAAVKRRGGVTMLRALAARRYPSISLDVALGSDGSPREWEYRLTFKQDNQRRPIIENEVVRFRQTSILERPDEEDRRDPERLRQTHLEQVNVNKEFRVVADFLATVRYMHIVPQLVREPDRSVGRVNDPFGGDFLELIARTPKRTRESRLRGIVAALKVAVPQLQELELQSDVRGVPHLRGKYQHWRPQGAWQTEEHFSDGTLRLLGLLWAVTESSGPLLLEEPELSLHPEVVRHIPQMFAQLQRRTGRQIILSSHSPEILNDSGIGNDEVLVLLPKNEGTAVQLLSEIEQATTMRAAGLELAEILRSLTAPEYANKLASFAS